MIPTRTAIAAAATLGTLLAPAAAEAAAPGSHAPVAHAQPPTTHGKPKAHSKQKAKPAPTHKPAPVAAVHVEGLVLRHTGASVTVQVRAGSVGRANVAHRVMTFALPRGSKVVGGATTAARIVDGSAITIVGSQSGKGGAVARSASVTPAPAGVLVGVARAAHGASLVVTASQALDGGGDDALDGAVYVDTSRASVTVDGASTTLSHVTPGAYVVVLGERAGDVVVASSVLAYAAAPAAALGTVAAVDGTTLTLAGGEEGDGAGGNAAPGAVVDTSAARVVLNGVSSTSGALSAADRVLALGAPDDAGVLHAQVVLAFDENDRGPAQFDGDRQGRGDGQGQGHGDD